MNDILNLEEETHHSQTLFSSQSQNENDENNALRNKIRERRKAKGFTFKELEKVTNISAAELCKIESGQRQTISIDTLKKLSPYLGVSLDYLLSLSVIESTSDHERFYDYDGTELDMFKIAKKLYFLDTELFLLLSETKNLLDETDREIIKEYIKITSISKSISDNNTSSIKKSFLKLFYDFRNYCSNFFDSLTNLAENNQWCSNIRKFHGKKEMNVNGTQ